MCLSIHWQKVFVQQNNFNNWTFIFDVSKAVNNILDQNAFKKFVVLMMIVFMHSELTMQYKVEHDNKSKGVKTVKLYPESS